MGLLKDFRIIAIGILVGLLIWRQFVILGLENDILKQQIDINDLTHNNETLENSIEDQNRKIKDAESKAKEFQDRFNDLNGDLTVQKEQSNKIIDALIKEKTPETCDEIAEYLKNGLEDVSWLD